MHLDITIHKGSPEKPIAIFIHGLGVNKGFWTDPVNTRVLAKSIPMKIFSAKKPRPRTLNEMKKTGGKYNKLTVGILPETTENLWSAAVNSGFNCLSWSQKRPVGPINIAVEELKHIVTQVKKLFPRKPIAIIGHSRGGLIARKFMEIKVPEIKALITIATPHAGSSLSGLVKYVSPLAPVLKRALPKHAHGTVYEIIKRLNDFLDGDALKELLPGSHFIETLDDAPDKDIQYLSFGGTLITLLTVYTWKKQENKTCPAPLLTIPDSLLKILPAKIIPDELTAGKGDFMVTAQSSVMPWALKHYNVPANHISISWNKKVISKTIDLLNGV